MAATTQPARADKVHALRMAAEQAAIEAKQIRAAAEGAQDPSNREYGLKQAFNADQRACTSHFAWRNAQARAKTVSQ